MNAKEAISILKLKEDYSYVDLSKSFYKMIKRYPPNHFPDKSLKIQEAFDVLSQSRSYWENLINSETLDLKWINTLIEKDMENSILKNYYPDKDVYLLLKKILLLKK